MARKERENRDSKEAERAGEREKRESWEGQREQTREMGRMDG